MGLRFDQLTAMRLRHWRETDTALFDATVRELGAISDSPSLHGQRGQPPIGRLVVYEVPGRREQYVITWELRDATVIVASISSIEELRRRMARRDVQ